MFRRIATIAAATLVTLGSAIGCRSDLLAPSAPILSAENVVLVRPYVRVIGADGAPLHDVEVRSDSGFYREGGGTLGFRVDRDVTIWPRAVPAPFVLEMRRGFSGAAYRFDVFPADGETLVIDLRRNDAFVRVHPPAALGASDIEFERVTIGIEVTNRSDHVEVDLPRSREYDFTCTQIDSMLFATALPLDVGGTWHAAVEWRTNGSWSGSPMKGWLSTSGVRTEGEFRAELVSRLSPMDLRVTWGDGAFDVDEFEYTTYPRIAAPDRESVTVQVRARDDTTRLVGLRGDVVLEVSPKALRSVLGSRSTMSWNGVDPVLLELGRHEFVVRVLDTEGRPRAFEAFQLEWITTSAGSARQTSDASGRLVWYVNEGEYVMYREAVRYDDFAPRGGPWRVTGDSTLVWETP